MRELRELRVGYVLCNLSNILRVSIMVCLWIQSTTQVAVVGKMHDAHGVHRLFRSTVGRGNASITSRAWLAWLGQRGQPGRRG